MVEELERVRAYRNDAPEPDAASVASARAELMQAISREPRPGTRRGRANVRLPRFRRRRRFALAGGLATIGVAAAGVFGFGAASAPPSALAKEMDQLARVAVSQEWAGVLSPGQYLYTYQVQFDTAAFVASPRPHLKECFWTENDENQLWIAADGSGAEYNSGGSNAKFTSAADQATCATLGFTDASKMSGPGAGTRYSAGGLSDGVDDWHELSTDPATLLKEIPKIYGGTNTAAGWFQAIDDLLGTTDAPPAIRTAVYQAVALIPGVQLMGQQTDPAGQSGLGVGYYDNGKLQDELIFDQQTGRLLSHETYDPTGRRTFWNAYLQHQVVNTVPDYPLNKNDPHAFKVLPSGDLLPIDPATGTATGPVVTAPGQATTSTPTNSSASNAPGVS